LKLIQDRNMLMLRLGDPFSRKGYIGVKFESAAVQKKWPAEGTHIDRAGDEAEAQRIKAVLMAARERIAGEKGAVSYRKLATGLGLRR
jgi:hypothetical protein